MSVWLAVSPHLDDAVFSAGATLWKATQAGHRVVIATVFTGNVARPTGFALACQLDKGLGPEVDYMALRRAEDVAACALLGAEARHLPLLEAPHRGYEDAAALFGPVHADDGMGSQVEQALQVLIAELKPDRLLGPIGIGNHVDHQIVRDALLRVADDGRVWWWEDWPYLDRAGTIDRTDAVTEVMGADARAAKRRACAAYASQLGFQFGGLDGLNAALEARTSETLHRELPTL